MALNPTNMANEIVVKLPLSWQPNWVSGQAPKEWVDKLVLDIQTMWSTVVLTSGSGPPPTGSYPHGHSVSVPIVPVSTNMSSLLPPTGLYTPEAGSMFTIVAAKIATHLTTSLVVATSDGAAAHDHTVSYPASLVQSPFAGLGSTSSTLKTAITNDLISANIKGAAMPDQGGQNSLDLVFLAVCAGVLEHMENNGQLSFSGGSGHVHTLS